MGKTYTIDISFLDLEETSTTTERTGVWHYYNIGFEKIYKEDDRLVINLDDRMIASVTVAELMNEGNGYGEHKDMIVEFPPESRGDAWKKLKNGIKINYIQLDIFKKYKN